MESPTRSLSLPRRSCPRSLLRSLATRTRRVWRAGTRRAGHRLSPWLVAALLVLALSWLKLLTSTERHSSAGMHRRSAHYRLTDALADALWHRHDASVP
jgi:hypothetical protein